MTERKIKHVQRELLYRIATEGVQVAYDTALAICRDPKATSPARATASATLFRVAGFFDRSAADGTGKEPHEMSSEEINAEIDRIRLRVEASNPDVFD
jgi:hypothetical protein